MSVFLPPHGYVLPGPELPLSSGVGLAQLEAITTPEEDLGPVIVLEPAAGVMAEADAPVEYLSPGRDPDSEEISFFRLTPRRKHGEARNTLPGVEGILATERGVRERTAKVWRIDRDPPTYVSLNRHLRRGKDGQALDRIFSNADFLPFPRSCK